MRGTSGHIERAVIHSLVCGDRERFELLEGRTGAIKVALQASLQAEGAADEVRRLLQMIVAFEEKLASPGVAEGLRNILRSDPDAMDLVKRELSIAGVRRLTDVPAVARANALPAGASSARPARPSPNAPRPTSTAASSAVVLMTA